MTIIDDLTKFAQARIMPDKKPDSKLSFLQDYFTIFGVPKEIVSDHGGEYNNKKIRNFANNLNIKWHFTSSEYHCSNGLIERFHATLTDSLRCYLLEHNNCSLNDALLIAVNSYNFSNHNSTSASPHDLVFPYRSDIEFNQQIKSFESRLRRIKNNQIIQKTVQKRRFDKLKTKNSNIQYQIGQKVLLKRPRNPNSPKAVLNTGPYEILSVNNKNKTLEILLDNNIKRKFHFNSAKPFRE